MKQSSAKTFALVLVKVLVIPLLIIAGIAGGALYAFLSSTPLIDVSNLRMNFTSFIYYVDPKTNETKLLQTLYDSENRVWVDSEDIPRYMKDAFVAIEDERFYQHKGFDIKRTLGAAINLVTKKNGVYGGSTITQQLVKNITGDDEVSLPRKLQEIYRAYMLEKEIGDKDTILELYLNTIYLSQKTNGVAAASFAYFDKNVQDLTLAECACIAGITQYPSKYDPYVDPVANKEKQEIVLKKMLELEKITQAEYDEAVAQPLNFKRGERSIVNSYSYFVDAVIDQVTEDLMKEKNYSEVMVTKMLYSGGLSIYCTVDPGIQKIMEDVYQNEKNFPADTNVQSAMVVMDPKNGEVKGIVGGRGKKNGSRTLNRGTQTLRQPGSTIKPLAVYAPAIEKGITRPNATIMDEPVEYGDWKPKNSDNRFHGLVSIKTALAQSYNIPAIKILDELGVDNSFRFLEERMHISSLVDHETREGKVYSDKNLPSLALGGLTDGISVLEMTAAYGALANKGIYNEPHFYTKILSHNGDTLYERPKETNVAVNEYTAYAVTDMLEEVIKSGTGTGAKLPCGQEAAGKTGTTSENYDKWFIGYTPYYVAAVWSGYDKPKTIAGNPAIPLWKAVMNQIHAKLEKKEFDKPGNLTTATVCKDSGLLATSACRNDERGSRAITEEFLQGTEPTKYCTVQHTQAPEEPREEKEGEKPTGEGEPADNRGEGGTPSAPPKTSTQPKTTKPTKEPSGFQIDIPE